MTASYSKLTDWTPEEEATARNLYELGVSARDCADAVNRLYKRGRTASALRNRMYSLHVVWGCRADELGDPEFAGVVSAKREQREKVGQANAEACAALRRAPWHPLNDPKPMWLRRPSESKQRRQA